MALRGFLGQAFRLKTAADYETGVERLITKDQGISAIDGAVRFVKQIAKMVASD